MTQAKRNALWALAALLLPQVSVILFVAAKYMKIAPESIEDFMDIVPLFAAAAVTVLCTSRLQVGSEGYKAAVTLAFLAIAFIGYFFSGLFTACAFGDCL